MPFLMTLNKEWTGVDFSDTAHPRRPVRFRPGTYEMERYPHPDDPTKFIWIQLGTPFGAIEGYFVQFNRSIIPADHVLINGHRIDPIVVVPLRGEDAAENRGPAGSGTCASRIRRDPSYEDYGQGGWRGQYHEGGSPPPPRREEPPAPAKKRSRSRSAAEGSRELAAARRA